MISNLKLAILGLVVITILFMYAISDNSISIIYTGFNKSTLNRRLGFSLDSSEKENGQEQEEVQIDVYPIKTKKHRPVMKISDLNNLIKPWLELDEKQIKNTPSRPNYHNYQSKLNSNHQVYFYPKMAKCGSTVMHRLLKELSSLNNFKVLHIGNDRSDLNEDDGLLLDFILENFDLYERNNGLINLKEDYKDPKTKSRIMVVVKHHNSVNFTKHLTSKSIDHEILEENPPNFYNFNLVRHPVHRWISSYNFCRFGMSRKPSAHGTCSNMTEFQLNESIADHIKRDPWISQRYASDFVWLKVDECKNLTIFSNGKGHNWVDHKEIYHQKVKAVECIKNKALTTYTSIGNLENLELSLKLFSKTMPEIFTSAEQIYRNSVAVARATQNSQSVKQELISNSTFENLEKYAFRFEMDIYNFILGRFFQQVQDYGVLIK